MYNLKFFEAIGVRIRRPTRAPPTAHNSMYGICSDGMCTPITLMITKNPRKPPRHEMAAMVKFDGGFGNRFIGFIWF